MMKEVDPEPVDATTETEKQDCDKETTENLEPEPDTPSPVQNDDDYSDSELDDTETNPLLSLEFVDGSESHVIIIDGEPKCYTKDIESANKIMWDMARYYKYMNLDFNTYIRECDTPMHIQLVGSRKFWAVSYDKVLLNISIRVIRGVKDVVMEASEVVEPTSTEDSTLVSRFFG